MGNTKADNKRIAKNTVFLYFRMILVLVVSLYTTRVVLNSLGEIDYGINNVVCGFVAMFTFLNTSMSNAIQRFYNFELGQNDPDGLNDAYISAIFLQVLLAIVVLLVLEVFGTWYINNKMIIPTERIQAANCIFHFSALSLFFLVIQIPFSAAVIAFERMSLFAYISILDAGLKLAIAFLIVDIKSDKLIFYGMLMLFISIVDFILYFSYCKIAFKQLKFSFRFIPSRIKRMLSFSGWNVLDTLAHTLKNQGTNVLLNSFFGPIINASCGIAHQISSALQGFSANVVLAFRPQLIQSYSEGNKQRVKDMMYSMTKCTFSIMSMLAIPLLLEVKFVIDLWLGGEVSSYTYSFSVIVVINMIIANLNTPLSQVVQATGVLKVYQLTAAIIIGSIIPISWIALKLGAAPISVFVVILAITVLNHITSMFILNSIFDYDIRYYCIHVLLPCFLFLLSTIILPLYIHLRFDIGWLRFILVCCSDMIIAPFAFAIIVLNSTERATFTKFIKSKILRK